MEKKTKLLAYHLRTKRVYGLTKDNTPKIENILVKLIGALSLEKYCKALSVRGYMRSDPPKIENVLERNEKTLKWSECGEKEIIEAQKTVDELLRVSEIKTPIDYKAEHEKQKKRSDDLERRLKALETKPRPGPKKKEESKQTGHE